MFSSAWLAAIVFAACSTLGYAAGEVRGSSTLSQAQRLFGEDVVAALDRRLALQAPASKHAKNALPGTAGNVGLPSFIQQLDVAVEAASVEIAAPFVVKRRLFTTAQPRAPPRSIKR